MSFLFGSFLLGTAAILAPILFHLIKRTPKDHYEFSSLMFLKPTPPQLTRRSRLDQWLLLAIRSLAILLLAIAFMRPYFRAQADLSLADAPTRHIAILIDRSASMQRGELWEKAIQDAKWVVSNLEPTDEVSLFAFEEKLETLVGPDYSTGVDRQQRRQLILDQLDNLTPLWGATELGSSLLNVAERLVEHDDLSQAHAALQIVLIADLQTSSKLDELQSNQWPEAVRLDLRIITPSEESNARLRLLQSSDDETGDKPIPRVRVSNASGSIIEQFEVNWSDELGQQSKSVPFYVPAGESLVLEVPYDQSKLTPDRLLLSGDDAGMEFDNLFYVVPPTQEQIKIAYFGSDADDDPAGMRFYLSRAFSETVARKVDVETVAPDAVLNWEFDQLPRLVVISESISQSHQTAVDNYLKRGGHVLVVLTSEQMVKDLGTWLGNVQLESSALESASENDSYVMLGEIDFRHPLFVPFSGSRYNDFTKIQFWKHRKVKLQEVENATVIARYEDQAPALWSLNRGPGVLYTLSSSWNREDSQLARSTKFVPLLSRWLELAAGNRMAADSYVVNQPVPLPEGGETRTVQMPDGTELQLSDDNKVFEQTTQPGIYSLIVDGNDKSFAVNLADSESEIKSLELEQLEQLGIPIGTSLTQAEQLERMRQLRDFELENEQKLWKWLIVAVLALLGIETLMAARRTRPSISLQESRE
ncbi:BatA domain-containing protein [Rubinisphaera italica]|uniref:VWFA domain-containing protein n=1 Tax=Rubinisphaera italica TaxID=2527969 RepID=A0A5C5XEB5_9PLAN|nr:BatA domain-containing protein [Rubinisphaera italica]TWT60465.1 hypothetical protein Pan54_11790 [Rubinisphaera italica]